MTSDSYYNLLENNFKNIIINNEKLYKIYNFISHSKNNILLYSVYGFPIELYLNEILKNKFNISKLGLSECIWEKNVYYNQNQYYFEIDLMNPLIPKDYSFLTKFILYILKSKNLTNSKHLIVIKHIDILREHFSVLKILLESFSDNAYFICTSYNISSIEKAIISRFTNFRIPLFSNNDIQYIFKNYLNKSLNNYLINDKSRNLIFCIFIADIEVKEPHLINKEFCTLNFPPLYSFIKDFNKKSYNLEKIRNFSYSCFQYNIKLKDLALDIIKVLPNKNKIDIINIATELEYKLIQTNKGREPIYIETLLSYVLL